MKPDLDAIRARWAKRGHSFDDRDEFERGARTDIPALLAYIETLEAALQYERGGLASCNRARQHCELECEDLRKRIAELEARTTYEPGETEWANRIAHAEARFVEEYDMRKAAERQVEELRSRIADLEASRNDETFDGTDAAHPAWWRGNDAGVRGTVNAVHRMLADAVPDSGAFGAEELNDLHARIKSTLAELAGLRSRVVTLESMQLQAYE